MKHFIIQGVYGKKSLSGSGSGVVLSILSICSIAFLGKNYKLEVEEKLGSASKYIESFIFCIFSILIISVIGLIVSAFAYMGSYGLNSITSDKIEHNATSLIMECSHVSCYMDSVALTPVLRNQNKSSKPDTHNYKSGEDYYVVRTIGQHDGKFYAFVSNTLSGDVFSTPLESFANGDVYSSLENEQYKWKHDFENSTPISH